MLVRLRRRHAWKAMSWSPCWLRKRALRQRHPGGRIKSGSSLSQTKNLLGMTARPGKIHKIQKKNEDFYAMPRNRSKPKMKLKTHRGAAKRFKITGTGKLIRMHSGKRHLLGTKAPKRMRKLKKLTQVNDADLAKTMQMLPYGLK